MNGQRPKVSLIVCTAGRSRLLAGCLESAGEALRSGDELIVVESAGEFGRESVDRLARQGLKTIHIRVEPPGKSRQLNAGIRVATGSILLLVDDDVRVPSSWADDMLASFADETVGVAFGPVKGLSRVPGSGEPEMPPPGEAPLETWSYAHGASMAVRRATALDVGGFDERLGPGAGAHGEDHDFVNRARCHGWRVMIVPSEPVSHVDWRSPQENRRNALVYERGGGAIVGTALRRSAREGWPVLRSRVSYLVTISRKHRSFGPPALAAFLSGLVYGLRLPERSWIDTTDARSGRPRGGVGGRS